MDISAALTYLDTLAKWTGGPHGGLGRVQAAAQKLDNPQDKVKTIHITGTNGKGSVATYLASILDKAGNTTGLFTSPHISKINERIIINGRPIADNDFARAVSELKSACEAADVELSFFEAVTLCGYIAFHQLGVEYAVIEVGLGGIRDATNIISKPEVAIITTVALDHQHILGETVEEIARDKSGIIKKGTAVVAGLLGEGPLKVIREVSAGNNATLYEYGKDGFSDCCNLDLCPALPGKHQLVNAEVAAKASKIIGIPDKFIEEGIARAFWPARLEWVHDLNRPVLFDAAHNPSAMDTVVEYLKEEGIKEVDILFGVVATKNWRVMIDKLRPFVNKWSLLQPSFASPVPSVELQEYLSGFGVSSEDFGTDTERASTELVLKQTETPLLVVGSIYMVAGVRNRVVGESSALW